MRWKRKKGKSWTVKGVWSTPRPWFWPLLAGHLDRSPAGPLSRRLSKRQQLFLSCSLSWISSSHAVYSTFPSTLRPFLVPAFILSLSRLPSRHRIPRETYDSRARQSPKCLRQHEQLLGSSPLAHTLLNTTSPLFCLLRFPCSVFRHLSFTPHHSRNPLSYSQKSISYPLHT